MSREADIERFYSLLNRLEQQVGGKRQLATLTNIQNLPVRGVYFFFEPGENRTHSGTGQRVIRVGTHALTASSRSTLKQRLRNHRGLESGGGNHRGSIFRLLVGMALLGRGGLGACPSWGIKGDADRAALALKCSPGEIKTKEERIEQAVTKYLGTMSFVWLAVSDDAGPNSLRGVIERNSIALLSNLNAEPIDPPSNGWLGRFSDRPLVRESGLWNQRHVEDEYDAKFLDRLEQLMEPNGPSAGPIYPS